MPSEFQNTYPFLPSAISDFFSDPLKFQDATWSVGMYISWNQPLLSLHVSILEYLLWSHSQHYEIYISLKRCSDFPSSSAPVWITLTTGLIRSPLHPYPQDFVVQTNVARWASCLVRGPLPSRSWASVLAFAYKTKRKCKSLQRRA